MKTLSGKELRWTGQESRRTGKVLCILALNWVTGYCNTHIPVRFWQKDSSPSCAIFFLWPFPHFLDVMVHASQVLSLSALSPVLPVRSHSPPSSQPQHSVLPWDKPTLIAPLPHPTTPSWPHSIFLSLDPAGVTASCQTSNTVRPWDDQSVKEDQREMVSHFTKKT